ncbi:MAG: cellulase family glycosylhydrolase [Cyclobacteriaceae bacterium]|nr:cellulase family glycosylhydrolase [Cyclobacteriaceae bacterium]
MFKYLGFFCILFILLSVNGKTQDRNNAFNINERLGQGINMGNAFEAPTETAWGNPWQPEYFEIIAGLGFQHVRLPVRWDTEDRTMWNEPYTINPVFLERIKFVVDEALKNKLQIIVNMHHHDALFAVPELHKSRFLSQWEQIADYFKDYSDSLLFEVLNEPHDNLTPELWNEYFEEALLNIRKTNPDRVVLMGTALFGGLAGVPHIRLPDDENIILSVHYYNPFNFTHQGAEWVGDGSNEWLGTRWLDTEAERQNIIDEFRTTLAFSEEHDVPVNVGEFGAYSKADMESRVKWTNFLARWFEEMNFSWAYWEFSAGFGIYNPQNKSFYQDLIDALLVDPMAEPLPVNAILLYQSDFTQNLDGWNIQTQGGAQANISRNQGRLQVNINSTGSEAWHIQLVRGNIPLVKDQMYRVRFTTRSAEPRGATFYAGRASAPWTSYSGFQWIDMPVLEPVHNISFLMNNNSDPSARLVFDLGQSDLNFEIYNISIEELRPVITSLESLSEPGFLIFPNPGKDVLFFRNIPSNALITIFDVSGKPLQNIQLSPEHLSADVSSLITGMYIISIQEGDKTRRYRWLKE